MKKFVLTVAILAMVGCSVLSKTEQDSKYLRTSFSEVHEYGIVVDPTVKTESIPCQFHYLKGYWEEARKNASSRDRKTILLRLEEVNERGADVGVCEHAHVP